MPDLVTIDLLDLPSVGLTWEQTSVGPYDHPQTLAGGICVDVGMAPLLQPLWGLGFQTQWSCQGDIVANQVLPIIGSSYIVFPDRGDAYEFAVATSDHLFGLDLAQEAMQTSLHMMTDDRASVTFPPRVLAIVTEFWASDA